MVLKMMATKKLRKKPAPKPEELSLILMPPRREARVGICDWLSTDGWKALIACMHDISKIITEDASLIITFC